MTQQLWFIPPPGGDGQGQIYEYDNVSSATINGGTVLPGVNGVMSLNDSGVFDGVSGVGRFLSLETVSDPVLFGASPTGVIKANKYFLAALNLAARQPSVTRISPGTYLLDELEVPDRWLELDFQQSLLVPATGSSFVIDISTPNNNNRPGPMVIRRFYIDGSDSSNSGIIGLTSIPSTLSVGPIIENGNIKLCDVGLHTVGALNMAIRDTICHRNTTGGTHTRGVGFYLEDSVSNSSNNVNLLENCEAYLNEIGIVLNGTNNGSTVKIINLKNCTIQHNDHCGLAAFDVQQIYMNGIYMEDNGNDSIVDTMSIDGLTVIKREIHLDNSSLITDNEGFASVYMANNSTLEYTSAVSHRPFNSWLTSVKTDGSNCKLLLSGGKFAGFGGIQALIPEIPASNDVVIRCGTIQPYRRKHEDKGILTNIETQDPTTMLTLQTQNLASSTGSYSGNQTDTTILPELRHELEFGAIIGSPSVNRVLYKTDAIEPIGDNDEILYQFPVRMASGTGEVRFDFITGTFLQADMWIGEEWQMLTLQFQPATGQPTSALYVYPLDDQGLTLYIGGAMVQQIPSGIGDRTHIQRIVHEQLWTDNTIPSTGYLQTLDDVTTLGATTTNAITIGDLTITDATPYILLNDTGTEGAGTTVGTIEFKHASGNTAKIEGYVDGIGDPSDDGGLSFWTSKNNSYVERMSIDDKGYVGIGIDPIYPLHVSIFSSDTYVAKFINEDDTGTPDCIYAGCYAAVAGGKLITLVSDENGNSGGPHTEFEIRTGVTGSNNGVGYFRGKVGIRTNSPSTELDVVGVITATSGNSTEWNEAYGWGDHTLAGYGTGGGSVTSVGMSIPVGFLVGGSPITTSGTLAITYDLGYSFGLPNDIKQGQWNTAYGWGNHALAGYGTGSGDVVGPNSATDNAIARFDTTTGKLIQNSTVTINDLGVITWGGGSSNNANTAYGWGNHAGLYQPIDATLTSLAGLGTVADRFAYTTAVDTWAEGTITAFARNILDDADAATVRATIGAGTGTLSAEIDTLDSVTSRGSTTSNNISVGFISATGGKIGASFTQSASPTPVFEIRHANGGTLLLSTDEQTVINGDKLGQINFQAPSENYPVDPQDAGLIAASIWAEADATFTATNNTCDIVFATAVSETATEKMRLTSGGNLDVNNIISAISGNSTQWNEAYSWGDHAGLYAPTGHTHTLQEVTDAGATTDVDMTISSTSSKILSVITTGSANNSNILTQNNGGAQGKLTTFGTTAGPFGYIQPNTTLLSSSASRLSLSAGTAAGEIWFYTGSIGASPRMVIDDVGQVGVGAGTPVVRLQINDFSTTAPHTTLYRSAEDAVLICGQTKELGLTLSATSAVATDCPTINGYRARGTLSTPTATINGDRLLSINAWGADSDDVCLHTSSIRFLVDGTPVIDSVPTAITFWTGSDGGGTEAMRIASDGNVGIGTTPTTTSLLTLVPAAADSAIAIHRAAGQPSIEAVVDGWMIIDSLSNPCALNYYSSSAVVLGFGGGNVGVGADTSPNFNFDVNDPAATTIVSRHSTSTSYSQIVAMNNGSATATSHGCRIVAIGTLWSTVGAYKQDCGIVQAGADLSGGLSVIASHASGGDIRFYAGGNADADQHGVILSSGEWGIGVTAPVEALQVAGTIANDEETSVTVTTNKATIDFRDSNLQRVDLAAASGTVELTMIAPEAPAEGSFMLKQDTTARDINFAMTTGSWYFVGTEPTWASDAPSSIRWIEWYSDATDIYLDPKSAVLTGPFSGVPV